MRNSYQDYPKDRLPGMSRAAALTNARTGMVHRALCETPILSMGAVETADWSSIWGMDACTANVPTISFARNPYSIDLLEKKRRVVASPESALFVNPMTEFRRDPTFRSNVVNDFIALDPKQLLDVISEWDPRVEDRPGTPFPVSSVRLDLKTFRIHRLLVSYVLCSESPDPLVVEVTGIHLLRRLLTAAFAAQGATPVPKKTSTRRAHLEAVEAAKEYIASNLTRSLRLDEIALAVGVAPAHFCGIFRRATGTTIHAYVYDFRLRMAFDLLPEFRGNLSQLALEMGFASGNHFSNSFRKLFGEPPSVEAERTTSDDASWFLEALIRETDTAL